MNRSCGKELKYVSFVKKYLKTIEISIFEKSRNFLSDFLGTSLTHCGPFGPGATAGGAFGNGAMNSESGGTP
jgi:hypothetical protein